MKFADLELDYGLHDGIASLGFEDTTPIQEQAIPLIQQNKDVIACAQTGTGKTAAYLIPTIDNLLLKGGKGTRGLILAPTRELANQIDQNIEALSYFTGITSVPVIGGKSSSDFERQKFALENGADIVVATPGRLLIYLSLGTIDFSQIQFLILDEADKMLDMGFHADIIKIEGFLPKERQTLMFSATMPNKIRELAKEILKDPSEINLNLAKPAAGINQMAFSVYDSQKIPLIEHLLRTREVESMIIFASSKLSVDRITAQLKKLKYNVEAMHSDKEQEERTAILRQFKNREFQIIVGTDVLARGIDIDNLSHVLNFDVPRDADDYVHRVGRTARASATGEAITFINPKDQQRFARIEALIEAEVPKPEVPADLGETPEYEPRRQRGGDRGGRGGGGRGGDRQGGNRRSGGGGRKGGGNRRQGGRNDQPRNQGGSDGNRHANGDPKPKKRRKRGGKNRRGNSNQGSSNQAPPQS